MAFHNVSLPNGFQYGTATGAGFSTIVQGTASGHEFRIARQAQPRHRFQLLKYLQTRDEAIALKSFAIGRRGALHSFRLKDWLDFTTNEDGQTAPTATDQEIGTADGTSNQTFQLVKEYDSTGASPYVRTITLPVSGSVLVAVNGTPTTSFSVSSTGVVTITASNGDVITAGCEFDVPVRFEREMDNWARLQHDAYNSWSAADLSCIEVLDEVAWPEAWWSGGVKDWGAVSTAQSIDWIDGQLHAFAPSTSVNVFLPAPDECPGGDRIFTVHNKAGSAGSLQILDDTGTAVGSSFAAGSTKRLLLLVSSGSATWVAV